jgi:exopolysaccharide biosynthesis polyprenyl glycosylphosphotransferase
MNGQQAGTGETGRRSGTGYLMSNYHRQALIMGMKVIDQFILLFCFFMALAAVSQEIEAVQFAQFLTLRIKLVNFVLYLIFALFWYLDFTLFGLYHSRRFASWRSDLTDIVNATSLGVLALLTISIFFHISLATPDFLFLLWLYTTSLTFFSRLTLRLVLERIRVWGVHVNNVLIIGTNPRAVKFARTLENKLEMGYRVVGFADNEWGGTRRFRDSGYPLVADFASLPDYLRHQVVDEVVIDLPLNSFYREVSEIVSRCLEQGIMVRFISDSFYLLRSLKLAHSRLEKVGDNVVISEQKGPMGGWPVVAKRVFDIVVALLLIIILAPVFVCIGVLIKLTSPGPIFFIQERVGLNKRRFRLIKFRTMIPDAEDRQKELEHFNEVRGPAFKMKDDPRITPIGRFLRRTSLDELPQLFNVLQGDMSLVGPRPLPVRDYNGFNRDWHRRRFSVRPGISCLWQISGRSNLPFTKWMHLDMEYIDRWSFWLDLKILALTLPAIIKEKGAY